MANVQTEAWSPRFEELLYQTDAVQAVLKVFEGQPPRDADASRADWMLEGFNPNSTAESESALGTCPNPSLKLSTQTFLEKVQAVQGAQGLEVSQALWKSKKAEMQACDLHLDIEMETGTGKTYVYTKTAYELYKRYGWGKFIIVVPSVAIREGVKASLEGTLDHFAGKYGVQAQVTVYNSSRIADVKGYVQGNGLHFLIMNIQAFSKLSEKAKRIIHTEQEALGYIKPIEAIRDCRPILILDEPQNMEGLATQSSLPQFSPLFILRYSATHKTVHDLVYRLDAVDAFRKKLVKQISVTGFNLRNVSGQASYVYLAGVKLQSHGEPLARIEIDVKTASGATRKQRYVKRGTDLWELSGGLPQYREGYIVSEIKATDNGGTITFLNGKQLDAGDIDTASSEDVAQEILREAQIRETIREHFRREETNFPKGIKTLSLFFLDKVANYRDYDQPDEKGPDARRFERIYQEELEKELERLQPSTYRIYLESIAAEETHNGYFCIDKKLKRFVDVEKPDEKQVDTYDLILKDKARLLSLSTKCPETKVRFIFSHSALREGWDNPNVFQICMFKKFDPKSSNAMALRQEVGRGLRLCVTEDGKRYHKGATHDVNQLTVITAGPGKEYIAQLQKEISEAIKNRPHLVKQNTFVGLQVHGPKTEGLIALTKEHSKKIEEWAREAKYIDDDGIVQPIFQRDYKEGRVRPLPSELHLNEYTEDILARMNELASNASAMVPIGVGGAGKQNNEIRKDKWNEKTFQEMVTRVLRNSFYEVDINSEKLIQRSLEILQDSVKEPKIPDMTIERTKDSLNPNATAAQYHTGTAIMEGPVGEPEKVKVSSTMKCDLVGELASEAATGLTRKTIVRILSEMPARLLEKFCNNPQAFISEVSRCINEAKVDLVVEGLIYSLEDPNPHAVDIFLDGPQILTSKCTEDRCFSKHIFTYVDTDSEVERKFAQELQNAEDVCVFAKLPDKFKIPTPVGNYNPDWAIAFNKPNGDQPPTRCIYFVAETKGDVQNLREHEEQKIRCARKYFERLQKDNVPVEYNAVTTLRDLRDYLAGAYHPTLLD